MGTEIRTGKQMDASEREECSIAACTFREFPQQPGSKLKRDLVILALLFAGAAGAMRITMSRRI